MIDKGWIKTKLGECAIINADTYSPKEGWPFINYLETGQITDNIISDIHYLITSEDKIPASARRKIRKGDIVYSTVRPNKNHFGIIKNCPDNFLVSTAFAVIRGIPSLADTSFIYYYITQKSIINFFHTLAEHSSSAYPSLQMNDIEIFEITLPPIKEQKAIAHILGSLDDKIELNRRMNKTLEEMARALFKSWFVDFDPVRAKMDGRWQPDQSLPGLPTELYDLFPDRLVPAELGEIPEGWQVRQFNNIAQSLTKKDNPLKSPDSIFYHYSIPAYDKNIQPKIELGQNIKSIKIRVKENTVLISRINPENNRVWLVDMKPDERAICSTEFLVLEPKPSFSRNYIYCLALTAKFHEQIKSLVTGTSKSHQRAPASAIMCLETIIPTPAILRLFELYTSDMLKQILVNRRQIKTLAELRDTLLPKLISGEIRVDELDIEL